MKIKSSFVIIFIVSFLFSQEEIIHISKTHRNGTPKEVIIYEIVNDELQSNNPFIIVEKISYDSKGNYVKPKISKNRGKVKADKAAALVNMVFVEGGTFQMGSNSSNDDENPVHTVAVSSFYMDKTGVTQAEYRKVMGENPSKFSGCDDCPVENGNWHDANEYAKKVGKRLPTEAEWEYAARGGSKSKGYRYSGSNDLDAVGWYDNNSDDKTHPVAQKQPNELGLYDMTGNVWEWCSDWYSDSYYRSSPKNDPQGPNSGKFRVFRGGSWGSRDDSCRVADRSGHVPVSGSAHRGFRLVFSQD